MNFSLSCFLSDFSKTFGKQSIHNVSIFIAANVAHDVIVILVCIDSMEKGKRFAHIFVRDNFAVFFRNDDKAVLKK